MAVDINKMKYYYQRGLWDINRLDTLLRADKITQEEYDEIIASKNDDE